MLPFINVPLPRGQRGRILAIASGAVVLVLAVISCSTISHQAVMLPEVPGAKYIGSSECEQCHEEIYRSFKTADHSRLIARGTNSHQRRLRILPRPVQPALGFGRRNHAAVQLHRRPAAAGQPGDASRSAAGAGQGNRLLPMPQGCARPVQLPNHHPVPEGRMTCTRVPFAAQGQCPRRRQHRPALPGRKLSSMPSGPARTVCV